MSCALFNTKVQQRNSHVSSAYEIHACLLLHDTMSYWVQSVRPQLTNNTTDRSYIVNGLMIWRNDVALVNNKVFNSVLRLSKLCAGWSIVDTSYSYKCSNYMLTKCIKVLYIAICNWRVKKKLKYNIRYSNLLFE